MWFSPDADFDSRGSVSFTVSSTGSTWDNGTGDSTATITITTSSSNFATNDPDPDWGEFVEGFGDPLPMPAPWECLLPATVVRSPKPQMRGRDRPLTLRSGRRRTATGVVNFRRAA